MGAADPTDPATDRALEQRFHAVRRNITHERIDDTAMTVSEHLGQEEKKATAAAERARTVFTAAATEFSRLWKAKAADLQPTIEDRSGYMRVLDELRTDRLPDFEARFFELMERQSQQNVAQLANEIRRAPGEVRERIAPSTFPWAARCLTRAASSRSPSRKTGPMLAANSLSICRPSARARGWSRGIQKRKPSLRSCGA
ncbi:hypothetical protein NHF46_03690 [Arthrobacter alpinus]|nr:hypothetical protein [Arthrobacter alpinus]